MYNLSLIGGWPRPWPSVRNVCFLVTFPDLDKRPASYELNNNNSNRSQSIFSFYIYKFTEVVNMSTLIMQTAYLSRTTNLSADLVLLRFDLLSLGRPTYMSAYLYFTTDSFFYSFFFRVWPPSSLNGTQPYPATWSEVKPPFGQTSQLNGNFNGLCLRSETWYT